MVESLGKITNNFYWSEAACRDGSAVPAQYRKNAVDLAINMQIVRKALGNAPIIVNSWYRTPAYNEKIGGAKLSQHLTASAIDFDTGSHSPEQLYAVVIALMNCNMITNGGIFLYDTFVHYDIRRKFVTADYRKIQK